MKYRFEQKYIESFENDNAAMDHACGWHDDRDAYLEKWINGAWRPAASPVYNPQFFYGKQDGGWVMGKNDVIPFDS